MGKWMLNNVKVVLNRKIRQKGKRPLSLKREAAPFLRFWFIIVFWGVLAVQGARESIADDAALRQNLIEFYERLAFVNSDKRLVRMKQTKNFQINYVCLVQNCEELKTHISVFIPQSWMKIAPTGKYISDASISIVVLPQEKFAQNEKLLNDLKLELRDGEHFYKDVSQNCVSFSIFKEHEIRKLLIISGNFPSWKMTVSCVVIQLIRSSGLAFSDTFDKLWSKDGRLSSLSDNNFQAIMLSLRRLIAIHFHPVTRPRMSQAEFRSATTNLNLKELTGGF
jgi:hypothetical protein